MKKNYFKESVYGNGDKFCGIKYYEIEDYLEKINNDEIIINWNGVKYNCIVNARNEVPGIYINGEVVSYVHEIMVVPKNELDVRVINNMWVFCEEYEAVKYYYYKNGRRLG